MQKEYNRPDEAALRRVLDREQGELGEIILRLAWNLGLTREEEGLAHAVLTQAGLTEELIVEIIRNF